MDLSPRENFEQMMRRGRAERLPLDMHFTPPVQERLERELGVKDLVEALRLDFRSTWVSSFSDEAAWRSAYARLGFDLPANAEVGWCGITHLRPPAETIGEAWHLREMVHPLSVIEDREQFVSLPWPRPAVDAEDHIRKAVERAHAEGRAAVGAMECTVFEPAWYLRGMERLFLDLIEGNGISDDLLDWFTERSCMSAKLLCAAGVDVIGLGDDVGTQRGMLMSPQFWREHLKPRLARVVRAIRACEKKQTYLRYHSDGDVEPIIEDLIEVGIDILNPVQPECMDIPRLIARFGDRIAFWGTIGIQTVMPFGSPEAVRAAVAQAAQWARDGAAIVVSPTHVLEPDVPTANIVALAEAPRALYP